MKHPYVVSMHAYEYAYQYGKHTHCHRKELAHAKTDTWRLLTKKFKQ